MHCHANARLTPRGRAEVFAAVEAGMTVAAACLAFRMSRRIYYRWLPRWQTAGDAGLVDRSSRPRRSPQRLSLTTERPVAALRQATGFGLTASPPSSAAGLDHPSVLRRQGQLERVRVSQPVVRYEIAEPGGLLHLDTKKLGRIVAAWPPGHRRPPEPQPGRGWEVLHVAIDAATRLVYAEMRPTSGAGRPLASCPAIRWFRARGVSVKRLLTDNGSAYRSRVFGRARRWLGVRHNRTRPYRPQTNGKAERWIRTVLGESLYLEVLASRTSVGLRSSGTSTTTTIDAPTSGSADAHLVSAWPT